MPLAMLVNADVVTQYAGMVIRAGSVAGTANLALADSDADVGEILGTRLSDVAPSNTDTFTGLANGVTLRLEGPISLGDPLYLSGTTAGVATDVAPAVVVSLGTAYYTFQISGIWYANVYFPSINQIPVPAPNSSANDWESDVVGNKLDDEQGSSLYSRGFKTDTHDHSVARVYPTMTAGATVTKSATPWTLGAFAVIVPAGTITGEFDVHGLNFDSVGDNGVYEIVLYAGPNGSEQEIGRTRFTRTAASDVELEVPFQTVINPAGSQIKAKLAGSNSSATAIPFSIRYHVY